MLELVGCEESAVSVCEVDGDEWCEVCGDVTVQVGADDADAITGSEGHQMCSSSEWLAVQWSRDSIGLRLPSTS